MAYLEIHWNANHSLLRMYNFSALVPDSCPQNCPTLYLLHGMSDDYSAWLRRTLIERYVAGFPLIVIFPDGGRSYYSDSQTMPYDQYESFFINDFIPYVDQIFPTIKQGNRRVIAGLSMGGYGALKFAIKYPNLFCAGLSFSGAFSFGHTHKFIDQKREQESQSVFGKKMDKSNDLFSLAQKLTPSKMPKLHFDCGVDDFCLEWNQKFHKTLTNLQIPHTYEEFPGAHNWNYWNKGIFRMMPWILKNLKIKKPFDPSQFHEG